MQDSDGRAAPAPPLVAIHHRHDARAWVLASALATVGMKAALLPPPEEDAAAWRDCRFDILAFDPFDARAVPRPRIDLARAIAARRPLIILSDRDAVEDRMLALTAGADDAVGWGADPIEAVARIAGLLRRARMALPDRPYLAPEERQRRKLVRRSHFMTIIAAWIITVPAAAALAAIVFLGVQLLGF